MADGVVWRGRNARAGEHEKARARDVTHHPLDFNVLDLHMP